MDPTSNDNKAAGSVEDGQMDEARLARRRLLKLGAASAPLMLTFKSSSAWANSAGCILQHGNLPIPGRIVKVDTSFRPIPDYRGYGGYGYDSNSHEISDYGHDEDDEDENQYGYNDYEQNSSRRRYRYKTIEVHERPGDLADADMKHRKLRALVYNDNMGMSCLNSITTF